MKSLGGRWDGDERKWYITADMDAEPFAQWMSDGDDDSDGESGETARTMARKPISTARLMTKTNASAGRSMGW